MEVLWGIDIEEKESWVSESADLLLGDLSETKAGEEVGEFEVPLPEAFLNRRKAGWAIESVKRLEAPCAARDDRVIAFRLVYHVLEQFWLEEGHVASHHQARLAGCLQGGVNATQRAAARESIIDSRELYPWAFLLVADDQEHTVADGPEGVNHPLDDGNALEDVVGFAWQAPGSSASEDGTDTLSHHRCIVAAGRRLTGSGEGSHTAGK